MENRIARRWVSNENPLAHLLTNRWFSLAGYSLVFTAAVLWTIMPGLTWQPLLLAAPALLLQYAVGKWRIPVPHSILAALFLIAVLIGVLISYDRSTAIPKFWVMAASIALFLAIAGQPKENLYWVLFSLSLFGAGVAIFFGLTFDYVQFPTDIDFLNRIGSEWMNVRPSLGGSSMINDVAGGWMAIVLPLNGILAIWASRNRDRIILGMSAASLLILLIGLFLSGARSAWLALIAAAAAAAVIGYIEKARIEGSKRRILFAGIALALLAAGIGLVTYFTRNAGGLPADIRDLLLQMPGSGSTRSRILTIVDGLFLAQDFTPLGSGLMTFPGLYSRYILDITEYYYAYSHNLLVDLWIEVGLIGVVGAAGIYFFAAAGLVKSLWAGRQEDRFISFLLIYAFLIVFANSLIEDPLFGVRGSVLLLVVPALAIAANRRVGQITEAKMVWGKPMNGRVGVFLYRGVGLALLVGVAILWKPIVSQITANIGAIQMLQIELKNWPQTEPTPFQQQTGLNETEGHFRQALALDPNNRTALYRLGLLYLHRQEFDTAVGYLEQAYAQTPRYRGIRKALAYGYAWSGDEERAWDLFMWMPEVKYEMVRYQPFWKDANRLDLALTAGQIGAQLEERYP